MSIAGNHPIFDAGGPSAKTAGVSQVSGGSFTTFGIITAGIVFWIASQNATGEARSLINMLLFTLLASMILLNWWKISPIFFKGGA